jgi:hypothetical protein
MGTWLFPSDHAQLLLDLAGYFSEKYHGNMVTRQVFSVVWSTSNVECMYVSLTLLVITCY